MTLGAIRSTGLTASRALAEFSAQKLFPEMMVKPKDMIKPEDTIKPVDTIKPEDMIKPELEPMMPVPGISHRDKMTAILLLIFSNKSFLLKPVTTASKFL